MTAAHPHPEHTMFQRALAAAPDVVLSGGYLSTPLWLDTVHDVGQVALIVIGIIVGLLRIEAMLRARGRNSGDLS